MDDLALVTWLRLRESMDRRSRSLPLTGAVVASLPKDRPVRVLDLGTGAGSNLRFLVPHLPIRQEWLVVDRSATLLSELVAKTSVWAVDRGLHVQRRDAHRFFIRGENLDCDIEIRQQDLGVLSDRLMFADRDLVTASALLDLVSASWLRTLAHECRSVGAVALFTLTYDGRFTCTPREPEDEMVRTAMNAHQHRDKGLGGPATGPDAAASAVTRFRAEGYRVTSRQSDWVLAPTGTVLQQLLIDGWARAANEIAPASVQRIAAWHARRLAHVAAGRSHLTVGHQDVAAL